MSVDFSQRTAKRDFRYVVLAGESPLHSDDSRESVLSIQAKETDYAKDTTDTESCGWSDEGEGQMLEYELETEVDEAHSHDDPDTDSSSDIISTHVISVVAVCEGEGEREVEFADSERSDAASDPELGPHDYWQCAQCRSTNNNPLYRYCEKCFKVRKNFFPPRPKRKPRQSTKINQLKLELEDKLPPSTPASVGNPSLSRHTSLPVRTDSGDSAYHSQEFLSQESRSQTHTVPSLSSLCATTCEGLGLRPAPTCAIEENVCRDGDHAIGSKRRRERETDGSSKRPHTDSDSDSGPAAPKRSLSDPAVTVETPSVAGGISARALMTSLRHRLSEESELCIVCCVAPKSGVFVHGRIAHICCCFKCADKVWATTKRCPVCKCKVSNVLRAIVS